MSSLQRSDDGSDRARDKVQSHRPTNNTNTHTHTIEFVLLCSTPCDAPKRIYGCLFRVNGNGLSTIDRSRMYTRDNYAHVRSAHRMHCSVCNHLRCAGICLEAQCHGVQIIRPHARSHTAQFWVQCFGPVMDISEWEGGCCWQTCEILRMGFLE